MMESQRGGPSGRWRRMGSSSPSRSSAASQQDQRRGELLAERAGLVDRAVGGGDAKLDVGEAVAAREDEASITDDGDRHARHPLAAHLLANVAVHGSQRRLVGHCRR